MTTPQPGQHVLIEAIARHDGPRMWLDVHTARGIGALPVANVRADVVRWHPADVPPQPPVLDPNRPVTLAGDPDRLPYTITGWDSRDDGAIVIVTLEQNSPASPPQATQDDPQPPNAADNATSPRDDPGATQGAGRDPDCVKAWPECHVGGYDPRCCRFPKSCSCWRNESEETR